MPPGQTPHVRVCRRASLGDDPLDPLDVTGPGRDSATGLRIRGHRPVRPATVMRRGKRPHPTPTRRRGRSPISQDRAWPQAYVTAATSHSMPHPGPRPPPCASAAPLPHAPPLARPRSRLGHAGTARYAYSPEKCPASPAVTDSSNRHPCRSRTLLAFRGHSPHEVSGQETSR